MKFSINNRFIVEPYAGEREIKATQTSGFAMIAQKIGIKALKLLVPVQLDKLYKSSSVDGVAHNQPMLIPKGALIYIKEELLYTQAWAKHIYEADGIGKFMIVDQQYIEFIDIPDIQGVALESGNLELVPT